MEFITHRFSDPDTLIDRVHSIFDDWERNGSLPSWLDDDTMHMLKLAIHEWLANLVQHADFKDRRPDISITVNPANDGIECSIEDNSEGFDLNGHLTARPGVADAFPERGMGLLMIKACTHRLSYEELSGHRHRLAFTVSTGHDPWLNIPF
ncbi:MAG: ATP-binding protein [Rhodothermales bacterium]